MKTIVLRDTGSVGLNDEDGRELARATVPDAAVADVVALIDRAIGWGHDLSYIDVEPASAATQER